MDATDSKKPFKVKDVTRNIKKAVCASTLEEIRSKIAEKFEKPGEEATIHLDSDGTEIDDEEYFRTLDENTELIAVFPGEHWIDPTQHLTISTPRDGTSGDTTDAAAETARIQQIVGQLKNNLCNVSVLSDPDLDSLSNMDPNSLVDITGKDFMEQLKDSGSLGPTFETGSLLTDKKNTTRPLCARRNAQDRINLLKLLREGAIFCSERYPEEAEAIDIEISRQLNVDLSASKAAATATAASTSTSITITTATETTLTQDSVTKTIMEQQQQNIEITTATTKALVAGNAANNNNSNSSQNIGNGNGNNNDI